jgi:hypothetical protein
VYLKALIYGGLLLLSTSVISQTSQKEIEQLKYDSEDLVEQIEYFEKSLLKLNEALSNTEEDLGRKRDSLTSQKSALGQNPSAANQRALNLIENSVLMNERSISTQKRRIERQTTKLEDSRKQLISIYKLIGEKEGELARASVKPAIAKKPTPTPKNAVVQPTPSSKQVSVKPKTPEPIPVETASPEQPNVDSPQVNKSVALVSKETVPSTDTQPPEAKETSQAPLVPYTGKELANVQNWMDKLAARLDRSPGRPLFRNVIVRAKGIPDTKMVFLGANQYRANIVLPENQYSFSINGRNYKREVDADSGGKEHVLILNAKRADRQFLYVFERDMLRLLDAPIE